MTIGKWKMNREAMRRRIREIVEKTLYEMPHDVLAALDRAGATITLLDKPPADVDDETFGTCAGATAYESDSVYSIAPDPPVIEIYLSRFEEFADDPEAFDEEVRLTVIHEVGHFVGFEEEDLEDV